MSLNSIISCDSSSSPQFVFFVGFKGPLRVALFFYSHSQPPVTRVRRYYARTMVTGHWDAAMGDRRTCHLNMCQPVGETCRQRPPDGQEESTEQLSHNNYNNPPESIPYQVTHYSSLHGVRRSLLIKTPRTSFTRYRIPPLNSSTAFSAYGSDETSPAQHAAEPSETTSY